MKHILTIGKNRILFKPTTGLNYRPNRGMVGRGPMDGDFTTSVSLTPEETIARLQRQAKAEAEGKEEEEEEEEEEEVRRVITQRKERKQITPEGIIKSIKRDKGLIKKILKLNNNKVLDEINKKKDDQIKKINTEQKNKLTSLEDDLKKLETEKAEMFGKIDPLSKSETKFKIALKNKDFESDDIKEFFKETFDELNEKQKEKFKTAKVNATNLQKMILILSIPLKVYIQQYNDIIDNINKIKEDINETKSEYDNKIKQTKEKYNKEYQSKKKEIESKKNKQQNLIWRDQIKQIDKSLKQVNEIILKPKPKPVKKEVKPEPVKKEVKQKADKKDYYYKEMLKYRPTTLSSSLILSQGRKKMEDDLSILITSMQTMDKPLIKEYKENLYPGYQMLREIINSKEPIKPSELKSIESAKDFEKAFKSETLMKKFLKQTKLRGLTDSQIDRSQLKIIETGSNYPQYNYTKDKNFPIDILVDVILDGVTIKKFAIELKFYDKTNMWTGLNIKGTKPAESGQHMSFKELLEIQNTFYNDYKGTILNDILEVTKEIQEDLSLGNDTKIQEEKLNFLKNIIKSQSICSKSFNDNVYGVYIGMKVTKTGYRFSEVTEEIKGINTLEFYENLKKYQNPKSPRLILNHDGIIEDVWKPRKNETSEHYFDLLRDRELLYCVSFRDACIICDYSKKIREGFFDPLNVFKNVRITKSMYGTAHADSMAIPLEYFNLFY